tara:strand:- start:2044 stop:3096 length:1053 start_codon:yes stop_codon:yes gene_type:complete
MSIDYKVMTKLIMEEIQNSPHKISSESTLKNYAGHLNRFMKRTQLQKDDIFKKENRDAVVKYLSTKGGSTRNQICSALKKYSLVLGLKEAIDFTSQQMAIAIEIRNSEREKKRRTKKKNENWIDFEILKREFDLAYHYLKTVHQKQKFNEFSYDKTYRKYDNNLKTAFYLGLFVSNIEVNQPRRALDWTAMRVVNKEPSQDEDIFNYCVTKRGIPKKVVFYNYKTSKRYGRQEFNINNSLSEVMRWWIHYHKGIAGDYLLPQLNGKPISVAQFSNNIDKVISEFSDSDKKVRVNMLRNITITQLYKDTDVETLISKARNSGHTLQTAKEWYIKVNELKPDSLEALGNEDD